MPHGHAGFGAAVLAAVAAAHPGGCPECVYWGKEDQIMLDVMAAQPDAKVGYTIANFSAGPSANSFFSWCTQLEPFRF